MYKDGFERGWDDAVMFAHSTPLNHSLPELAFRERWFERRRDEYRRGVMWHIGQEKLVPEFDHGMAEGFTLANQLMRSSGSYYV
jgi:hypothetical protein